MDRREFLKAMGVGAASLFVPGCTVPVARTVPEVYGTKPNIVLILADDLGWHQLGCYGSTFYETANLDRLATESMRFTDAYAACPVCSPTRASIMTGKYPARLHLTDYIPGRKPTDKKLLTPDWMAQLAHGEVTIAEALKLAGYTCGHFGKWHLNKDKEYEPDRPGDPGSQGFDEVLTTRKPNSDANPYRDAHHVKEITDRATKFMRENRYRPFFCYVTHNSIHRPDMEKIELINKYKKKPGADNDVEYGHNNPKQAAMLETLDKSVDTILEELDELELRDNTIVVFFSDNGHLGSKDSTPLRGSKANLYEGGIRVPLIVRWPGVVEPGSVSEVPVISNDLFPTFTEVAGLDAADPTIDGVSLIPVLAGAAALKRDALYWHYPHYHHQGIAPSGAIRRGRYKLIEWFENSADGIGTEGALELYDLKKDLNEQNNLAAKMPRRASGLHRKLKQWRKSVGAQVMAANPQYSPNQSR